MIEMSLEEEQKIEFDLLVNFVNFCESKGLKYYLAYGTLLGAVRHKGFIPWDDDVDVYMPRKDYNILIEEFNKEENNGYIKLIDPYSKISRHSIVKIIDTRAVKKEQGLKYKDQLGVDIDIWPLDGMPDDEKTAKLWFDKLKKVYRDYSVVTSKFYGGFINSCKLLVLKVLYVFKYFSFNKNKALKKADKIHKLYPLESSKDVCVYETPYHRKRVRYKKEYFGEGCKLKFNGIDFCAPNDYDTVLKLNYGDYMELPPKEQRVTHHSSDAFWKN